METTTQIGASIHIKGELTAKEPLTVAGRIDGSVDVAGHRLTITEAGRVTADIVAHTIIVDGHVNGTLSADASIIVHRTATIEGDLAAPSVTVDDGAQLQGRFEIGGKRAELSMAS
jgi:cytoskeletal protein CcmA (bactofilin family)